jgi:hypothetical protein
MKVNNKNIIITDPCYLDSKDRLLDDVTRLPFKFFPEHINDSTLYGDWSCMTFKTINGYISSLDGMKEYVEEVADGQHNNANDEVLGNFCADSGMVCVVFQDDVLKFNTDFGTNKCYVGSYYDDKGEFIQGTQIIESVYDRLATLIPDFTGEIDFHDFEIEGTTHRVIVGFGNINFYTLQTGF